MPGFGGFESFGFILLAAAVWALWSTVKIVPQGYAFTVENLGRYTLAPGMHILIPVLERVVHKMNMKEQVMDIPSQDVITRDNAMVRVDGVARFSDLERRKGGLRGGSARAFDGQPDDDEHPYRHGVDGPR